jgi:hypothetical protein
MHGPILLEQAHDTRHDRTPVPCRRAEGAFLLEATAACEIVHDALPRKRCRCGGRIMTIRVAHLSAVR